MLTLLASALALFGDPVLTPDAVIERRFDNLNFYLEPGRRVVMDTPSYTHGGVLSEDGRFAFWDNRRVDLVNRTNIEYFINVAYRRGSDGKPWGIGAISSLPKGNKWPALDRFKRSELQRVYASQDGTQALADINHGYGEDFHLFGYVPMTTETQGRIVHRLKVGVWPVEGSDDRSAMVVMKGHYYLLGPGTRMVGPVMARSEDQNHFMRWQSATRSGLRLVTNSKWTYGFRDIEEIRWVLSHFPAGKPPVNERSAPLPARLRRVDGPKDNYSMGDFVILPGGRRVIANWKTRKEQKPEASRILLYDFDQRKWSLLGEGITIRAASASGRRVLIGSDDLTQPAWVVRFR